MVHGHVTVIDSDGAELPDRTTSGRAVFGAAHRNGASYASYASECRCLSSTILVRREVFDTVGFYDPELPIEDYDFYLRLLLDYDLLFLDSEPLAKYRSPRVHDARPRPRLGADPDRGEASGHARGAGTTFPRHGWRSATSTS